MPSALPDGDPAPADGRLPRRGAGRGCAALPFGVYVHVPFCETRCGYCDFNTYTAAELGGRASRRGGYADTVLREMRLAADVLSAATCRADPAGVDDLLRRRDADAAARLHLGVVVREIAERFGLAEDVEITTEANPETVTRGYLSGLREQGFTRLSLGMQSAVSFAGAHEFDRAPPASRTATTSMPSTSSPGMLKLAPRL